MQEFFWNAFSGIRITDIIDILIVAVVVYKLLGLIKQTRAEQLFKGVLLLVVATFLSDLFNLHTINWILKGTVALGAVAILVVFQPELRRGLEYLGRSKFSNVLSEVDKEEAKYMVGQLVEAIDDMSASKTGALIVIERETSLSDLVETGTVIDAAVSAQMIGNIFYEGAPLHDGALIIRGDRLYAAGCVLPLTQNKNLNKELGTRHRAGIGISENSDALVIIVSEETGIISIAQNGKLTRFLDVKKIEKTLYNIYLEESNRTLSEKLSSILKGVKQGGKKC